VPRNDKEGGVLVMMERSGLLPFLVGVAVSQSRGPRGSAVIASEAWQSQTDKRRRFFA
jgi:hypothetical protein